eukprot:scaffold3429_cov339-Prasinococcus_capsulatus_cf.AAC.2
MTGKAADGGRGKAYSVGFGEHLEGDYQGGLQLARLTPPTDSELRKPRRHARSPAGVVPPTHT